MTRPATATGGQHVVHRFVSVLAVGHGSILCQAERRATDGGKMSARKKRRLRQRRSSRRPRLTDAEKANVPEIMRRFLE